MDHPRHGGRPGGRGPDGPGLREVTHAAARGAGGGGTVTTSRRVRFVVTGAYDETASSRRTCYGVTSIRHRSVATDS
ncbi:hypothetical protein DF268_35110 [Streptomyces sp. V2]|nr:hypothetical protein DF268_35110 [Streptomyces sp. V2]